MDNLDIKSFFGQITKVNNTGGWDFPNVINTTYDVQFVYNNQVFKYQNVVPNNQRPVKIGTIQIVPAQVGDICGVYWADNKVSFFITEGLEVEDCSIEQPRFAARDASQLSNIEREEIRLNRLTGFTQSLPRMQSVLDRTLRTQSVLNAQRAAQ